MTLVDTETPVPASQIATTLPRAPRPERVRRPGRWRRRAVLAGTVVAVVAGVLILFAQVVEPTIHSQRQAHLSAAFQTPKPKIEADDAVAVIQVPKLAIDQVVVEGVGTDSLRGGPARDRDGALPGDAGVVLVFGHRHGYGAPFERLDELVEGDPIVAQARGGPIVQYVVQSVLPDTQLSELDLGEGPPSLSYLVLVTTDGGRFSDRSLVVIARALPLSDVAPAIPDLDDAAGTTAPFGLNALGALASLVVGVAAHRVVRGRAGLRLASVVAAPLVLYGVLQLMFAVDQVMSITR